MSGHQVGGWRPPVLPAGMFIHPLFGSAVGVCGRGGVFLSLQEREAWQIWAEGAAPGASIHAAGVSCR